MSEAPFTFSCHRCGHCCSVSTGYVWVQEEEIPQLANALSMTVEAFSKQYLRLVEGKLSLIERDGRCALFESPNHCTVYLDRPKHCREFPYWPDILAGGEALERASSYCPGIQILPSQSSRQSAFAALENLYQRLEQEINQRRPICVARGVCCEFEKVDHELYASQLEVDYALVHGEELPGQSAANRCRYHLEGRCHNRVGRPLGCRAYFCDPSFKTEMEDLYQRYYKEIQEICNTHQYPWSYGPFVELLKRSQADGRGMSV